MESKLTSIKDIVYKYDDEELIKEYEETPDYTFITHRITQQANSMGIQKWAMDRQDKSDSDRKLALRQYVIAKKWLGYYDAYLKTLGADKKGFDKWLQKELNTHPMETKKVPDFIAKLKAKVTESTPIASQSTDEKEEQEKKPKKNK